MARAARSWMGAMVLAAIAASSASCHRGSSSGEATPVSSSSTGTTPSPSPSPSPLVPLANLRARPAKDQGDPLPSPGEAFIEAKMIPDAGPVRPPGVYVEVLLEPHLSSPDHDESMRITRALDGVANGIALCVQDRARTDGAIVPFVLTITARADGSGAGARASLPATSFGADTDDCIVRVAQAALGGDARAAEITFETRVVTH